MKAEEVSEEELNDQINDKLNQLWTGVNDRRKKLVRNLTPNYSRRTDQSSLNQSSTNCIAENQLLKIRDKLALEVSAGKKKDLEIDGLRKTIAQLTNDKKMLVYELQQIYGNNENANSSLMNESSIIRQSKRDTNKNTANFESLKKKRRGSNFATIDQQCNNSKWEQKSMSEMQIPKQPKCDLQDLRKSRLVELLRSTAEYRQFVFYYDSHQLSYLKRLQQQHKKNCDHSASVRQKSLWAPTEVLLDVRKLNKREKWGLTESQIQSIVSYIKAYYEQNNEERLRKAKQQYQEKLKKQLREVQYGIPYDLVQICKSKERQLSKQWKRCQPSNAK